MTMDKILKELKRANTSWEGREWSWQFTDPTEWKAALATQRPEWYLWTAGKTDILVGEPPEILDWCAEREPRAALEYAAKLLTPEQRAACEKAVED